MNDEMNKWQKKDQQQCGITQLRPRTKVVGGMNSAFGAWPWQVLLSLSLSSSSFIHS